MGTDARYYLDDLDRLSRSDPWAIPAGFLGKLRRSPDPRVRAVAARVHALRRPRAYLRTIASWWADDSDAVRAMCLEGLGLAAISEGCAVEDRPDLLGLIARGERDPSSSVRAAAEETAWLLAPVDGGSLPPAAYGRLEARPPRP